MRIRKTANRLRREIASNGFHDGDGSARKALRTDDMAHNTSESWSLDPQSLERLDKSDGEVSSRR
jgi:hypothetical protein